MHGRFVVFEGIDGAGKSTCLAAVAEALRHEGQDVWATREETETDQGDWVRASIREGLDPLATTFLFLADRAQHVVGIEAARAAGRTVLCDRFLHSTLAYQGVTLTGRLPDPERFLRALHDPWCPLPDHVVLLKGDPAALVERTRRRRGEDSRYEKAAFLEQVQDRYLGLAQQDEDRFTVLDAMRPPEEVARQAIAAVRAV